ncbi:hypothetical protein J21TS7_67260 [Paenibacillus cineris]|uniref:Uncharacterized protein n=1 Tax=Paenibacillus cineris TaxID=237530 RepID=A0ABQ4LQU7_9BACL|nr:hypothetical protein J21TS7_67260 [Paenibacillus cineris]
MHKFVDNYLITHRIIPNLLNGAVNMLISCGHAALFRVKLIIFDKLFKYQPTEYDGIDYSNYRQGKIRGDPMCQ